MSNTKIPLSERSIKIKGLIHEEVGMGTYGLVELELQKFVIVTKSMRKLKDLPWFSIICCLLFIVLLAESIIWYITTKEEPYIIGGLVSLIGFIIHYKNLIKK